MTTMWVQVGRHGYAVVEDDLRPFWDAVATGRWEASSFDVLDRFLPAAGTFVDLGCHAGALSLYAAASGARVVAVDPDPEAARMFRANLVVNPGLARQVQFVDAAVGVEDGRARLFARPRYGLSSSSLIARSRDTVDSVEVRTLTLPALIAEAGVDRVDLIKMDIEGGEFRLLPRLADALGALGNPTIFVSFHLPYLAEHLFRERFGASWLARLAQRWVERSGLRPFSRDEADGVRAAIDGLRGYPRVFRPDGGAVESSEMSALLLGREIESLVFASARVTQGAWS